MKRRWGLCTCFCLLFLYFFPLVVHADDQKESIPTPAPQVHSPLKESPEVHKPETTPPPETQTKSEAEKPQTTLSAIPAGYQPDMAGMLTPKADTMLFTGAATAAIPIDVPPGKAGIAPKIALTYNSYQPNGWIGVGWTLDMGSIQRATKRSANYTSNDYVASVNGSVSELVARCSTQKNKEKFIKVMP
jgi:hypothetical protein